MAGRGAQDRRPHDREVVDDLVDPPVDGAEHQYKLALVEARRIGNRESEAITLSNLSSLHFDRGDYRAAMHAAQDAIAAGRVVGSGTSNAVARINLGAAQSRLGHLDDATMTFEDVLADVGRHGPVIFEVGGSIAYGEHLVAARRYDQARAVFERAGRLADEHGFHYWSGRYHLAVGTLDAEQGDLKRARTQLRTAVAVFEETSAVESTDARELLQSLG